MKTSMLNMCQKYLGGMTTIVCLILYGVSKVAGLSKKENIKEVLTINGVALNAGVEGRKMLEG